MPRHRLPTAIHEVKGTFIKHPERRRKAEPRPNGPLGPPPRRLGDDQIEAWREIVECCPPGVLTKADRLVLELTARLLAEMWAAGKLDARLAARLEACLGKLGMTPADRSKVTAAQAEKQESPWDRLAGPAQ